MKITHIENIEASEFNEQTTCIELDSIPSTEEINQIDEQHPNAILIF